MLLHQQIQDNMLEEVVSFGQRAQQQQDQQQLQLRQHNIPHNPVLPEIGYEPKTTKCGSTKSGWPTWSRSIILAEQFVAGCSSRMGSGIERNCSS